MIQGWGMRERKEDGTNEEQSREQKPEVRDSVWQGTARGSRSQGEEDVSGRGTDIFWWQTALLRQPSSDPQAGFYTCLHPTALIAACSGGPQALSPVSLLREKRGGEFPRTMR